jgi:hypothetical protein
MLLPAAISRDTSSMLLRPPARTVRRREPPEQTSYGEPTWTRRLVRDVLGLIEKENLIKPVVVVHGFLGSVAADEPAV